VTDDPEFEPGASDVDPAFYAAGGSCLSVSETDVLGDIRGLKALVAPAGSGEEALSLKNAGAVVTVLDTGEGLDVARALAEGSGLEIEFIDDDANGIDMDHRDASFDLVYSPWGAIDGLDNLDDWARGVAAMLRPGGRLVCYDEHPVAYMMAAERGQIVVAHSYFGEPVDGDDDGEPGGPMKIEGHERTTFSWTVGDLVSALGAAGLATVLLEEFPESDRFQTPLDQFEGVDLETLWRVPAALLLAAIKF
jgi:SAM-dependent methyltransferase